MKAKARLLTMIFPSLLLGGMSAAIFAADEPNKPSADPGTTMQSDQPAATQGQPATQAAKPSTDVSAQLKSLDTDKDGAINKAEADKLQGLSDTFETADKNQDGKLDAAELSTAISQIKQ